KTLTIQLDKTKPALRCGAADGVWHPDDVSIACAASDSGSGLASGGDASFALTTTVPSGTEADNAATGSRTVCDLADNCATGGPISGNNVDKQAPSIAIGMPTSAVYLLNQAVAASYSC